MNQRKQKILELFDHSGSALHNLLYRLTLCQESARDLLQDVFVKLLNHPDLEKVRNLEAYARRTAIHAALDWRRRRQCVPMGALPQEHLLPGGNPDAVTQVLQKEQIATMLDALSDLPDLYQQVIVLRYLEQQDYDTIAEQLDKKPQHLRSICSKGLAKLQHCLNRSTVWSVD